MSLDESRFIIGIDLGTTNTSVSYVDTSSLMPSGASVESLRILQCARPSILEQNTLLPSCCYLVGSEEWPKGSFSLPWMENPNYVIGQLAQQLGKDVSTRLVNSAKSWLASAAHSQSDILLPLDYAEDRISPVEALSRVLLHVKQAWNTSMSKEAESDFNSQQIIITVPASFDEICRALTVEAAKKAGYTDFTLLEEPQAVFYHWLMRHEKDWHKHLKSGDCVLVCDIGGGTTDFSLIHIEEDAQGSQFKRMSVGRHLLLGGDNLDEALCHYCNEKLKQHSKKGLEAKEWTSFKAQVRQVKEKVLDPKKASSKSSNEIHSVIVRASGRNIVKNTKSFSITTQEIKDFLLNGFFRSIPLKEAEESAKNSALKSYGLPYETNPLITAHLAAFLEQARKKDGAKLPSAVLFNGGSMKPMLFQQAIVRCIADWYSMPIPKILDNSSMDLAVSKGAAYFGKAKRGMGIRISGGFPRGFYLKLKGIDDETKALTLLPRGSSLGSQFVSEREFSLIPNAPVSFEVLTSDVRLHDQQGDLISISPTEMRILAPLHTIIRYGKGGVNSIPVRLAATLTEMGILEIWLESVQTTHRWRLEFQLRGAKGQESSLSHLQGDLAHLSGNVDIKMDALQLSLVKQVIEEAFSEKAAHSKIVKIIDQLEECLGLEKENWPVSILRSISDALLVVKQRRSLSKEHDFRWWNLLGYSLRPGCGTPLDDFRVKELWKIILSESKHSLPIDSQIQRWICYRRIAAGLNKGQQSQLGQTLLAGLNNTKEGILGPNSKESNYVYSEKLRCFASFEQLELNLKIRVADLLLHRIKQHKASSIDYWALSRLGSRRLIFANPSHVVPVSVCQSWIMQLLDLKEFIESEIVKISELGLNRSYPITSCLLQLCQNSGYPELDITQELREKVLLVYKGVGDQLALNDLFLEKQPLSRKQIDDMLLDALPIGISLRD